MKYRYLLGAGVALAMSLSAADSRAQLLAMPTGPGVWYFGGEGGWTDLENQSGHVGPFGIRQTYKDGFNVGARGGYEWGPWRFEEEFRYQQNGDQRLSIGGANLPNLHGDRTADAIMTNAIYDFTFGFPVTPHIGVGVGAVDLHDGAKVTPAIPVSRTVINGVTIPAGVYGGEVLHSSDWEFGYQAIAGIRYNINPALAFDLDYRYLATTDAKFTVPGTNVRYSSGYSTHNVTASLTLRFGAPPPPPPIVAPPIAPPPPVVSRRVFLVFFDWDRDTITPEGMQIIHQAADAFRSGAPVQIQVTGYTDRSGSVGYNQRLSERRANNVANALARSGVPRNDMLVSGRGENDNRVPTANGVREPQNRRVEIVFP